MMKRFLDDTYQLNFADFDNVKGRNSIYYVYVICRILKKYQKELFITKNRHLERANRQIVQKLEVASLYQFPTVTNLSPKYRAFRPQSCQNFLIS